MGLIGSEDSDSIIEKIKENGKYSCNKLWFYDDIIEYYSFYKKHENCLFECFRIVKNAQTGKAFFMPNVLNPNIEVSAIKEAYKKVKEISCLSELPMFDIVEDKEKMLCIEAMYRIMCYFLDNSCMRNVFKNTFG